jgi:hypothetical protein
MGAGISLGEEQIAEIVKRDLCVKYETRMNALPACLPEYETWRNSIEQGHHSYAISQVDKCKERVIAYKNKYPNKG